MHQSARSRAVEGAPTSRAPRVDVATWFYALSLAWWSSAWHLRNSLLMDWVPVEPLWVGALAVALCVVHRLSRPVAVPHAVLGPFALLVLAFLPGVLISPPEGYGPTKVSAMLVALLPVVAASLLLLDSERARVRWVWAQVVVGVVVALAAVEVDDPSQALSGQRLTLASVDTISTGRLIGAAVVALLIASLASPRSHWWAWPVALASGAVLVQVGSRGPLLAVVLSLLVVVLVSPYFRGRRRRPLLAVSTVAVASMAYALSGGGAGGRRIIDSVSGDLGDETRTRLLGDAWEIANQAPWGIGWGAFALRSDTGEAIANSQGAAYAHNVFAEVLVEGGFVALLALAAVVVLALTRSWRAATTPGATVVLGVLLFWILNAQVSADVVGNRITWLMLVCGLLSHRGVAGREATSPDRHGAPPATGRVP